MLISLSLSRETKADGEVVEPGREVEEGKYFHPKFLEILKSVEEYKSPATKIKTA